MLINSLRTRLILIFILFAILPITIFGIYVIIKQNSEARVSIEDQYKNMSFNVSKDIKNYLNNSKVALEVLSELPQISDMSNEINYSLEKKCVPREKDREKWETLDLFLSKYKQMEYVFVISDEGKLLNLVPDNLLQRNLRLNYAFKPWFVEAMTSGGTVFSEMDFLETEKGLSILISTPIIDNYGVIKGVIGCGLDHLAIDNFLKPPRLSEKEMVLLLDKNNMVLKQSGVGEINVDESDIGFKNPFLIDWAPEKLKKDQGSTIWKKQGVIYSFCEIENLNWKVVVQTPIKEAFKKINFTRNMFLLFVLLVVGVSLVLSIVFVSKLLPPLEELKKGLNRLAIGDFDFRIKVSAQKEFRELVSDFNAMAVKLQETILKLRSKSR